MLSHKFKKIVTLYQKLYVTWFQTSLQKESYDDRMKIITAEFSFPSFKWK
jgi:hypothetical protein